MAHQRRVEDLVFAIINDLSGDDFMDEMTIFQVIVFDDRRNVAVVMDDPHGQGLIQMFAVKGREFKSTVEAQEVFDEDFNLQAVLADLIEMSDDNIKRRPFG